MLPFPDLAGFDWDHGNERKNEKHGVSQKEAEQVFFNQPMLVLEDRKHATDEPRYHALGKTDDERLLHITFTARDSGKKIRVISARPMHWKEREIYAQTPEAHS